MSRTRDDGSCDYCGGVWPMINGVPCPACDGTGHGGYNGPNYTPGCQWCDPARKDEPRTEPPCEECLG